MPYEKCVLIGISYLCRVEKQVFNFKSSQFSEEIAAFCTLKAVLGVESAALLLSDQLSRPMGLCAWHFDNESGTFEEAEPHLRHFLTAERQQWGDLPTTTVALSNNALSLVPKRMFHAKEEDLSTHFRLQMRQSQHLICKSTPLEVENAHLVYGAEPIAWNLCKQYFPKALVRHLAEGLVDFWRGIAAPQGVSVFANFRNQQLQVAVFEHQQLLLLNTYDFQKASDALYFSLLPFEQFKIKAEESPFRISGNLLEGSEIWKLLSRYLRHLQFESAPNVHFPAETAAFPPHFWTDLVVA
jgi:hypothetical protein